MLGGGGARGLAHLGVLKVLEREGFRPDLIVGCSIGAIIGAMYCQTPEIDRVEKRVRHFLESETYKQLGVHMLEEQRNHLGNEDYLRQIARNIRQRVMLNMVASRQSILKDDVIGQVVNYLVEEGDITETKIPFACNATDLITGEPVLFKSGDIRLAVKASSTVPGYFQPLQYDSKFLVDGAVTHVLPDQFARSMNADYTVGVDVSMEIEPITDFQNVFDIILRANNIVSARMAEETSGLANLTIRPEVKGCMWYDFRKLNTLIKPGEDATYPYLSTLREHIRPRRKGILKTLFARFR